LDQRQNLTAFMGSPHAHAYLSLLEIHDFPSLRSWVILWTDEHTDRHANRQRHLHRHTQWSQYLLH